MIYWGYAEELASLDSADYSLSPFKASSMADAVNGAKEMNREEPWEPGELAMTWLWTEHGNILGFVHQGIFYRVKPWENKESIHG
jgi:hypothetical protein